MSLLDPASVALIGASDDEKKLGGLILNNLLKSGYRGKVFPINPKHDTLQGHPCFRSIEEVPCRVELAVIVTPAATVAPIADACGKAGVSTLIVISAGFGELATQAGKEAEEQLQQIVRRHGMRLIGPNCLGILRPPLGLNASFAATPSRAGNIGLISQSGAMAVALLDAADDMARGFSSVISIGNKADIDECDLLLSLKDDDATRVIGLYLESIRDGRRLAHIAADITPHKPIILLKAGTSKRGAKAAASHTGALAGTTASLHALCHAGGIIRATSTGQFLALLATHGQQPALTSRRIAVITNAGGPGVLATDAAEQAKLQLVSLAPSTETELRSALPPAASIHNPIDLLGDARDDRFRRALTACARDPGIDGIAVLLTPQAMTPCEDIASAIVECHTTHPLLPLSTAFIGGPAVQKARRIVQEKGIPTCETPEEAIEILASLHRPPAPSNHDKAAQRDHRRATKAEHILGDRPGLLGDEETSKLLALYQLPTPEQGCASSGAEAVSIARHIGLPVVAKISAPEILHKTDIGGVRTNLRTLAAVKTAYTDIRRSVAQHVPTAHVRGVLIQQFLPVGQEFILGGIRDASIGPLVMVGIGGIYTELMRDTVFRIAPLSQADAYAMLTELRSWKLLTGMRGKGPLDIDGLARAIVSVGNMMSECPSIQEIDLNPILVRDNSISVADAKVIQGDCSAHA